MREISINAVTLLLEILIILESFEIILIVTCVIASLRNYINLMPLYVFGEMPRGFVEEKSKIDAYRNCSVGKRDIGRRINRPDAIIRNYFKMGKNYGKIKLMDGNEKITKRSIGQIKEEATKNRPSASQIVSNLILPIETRHVQQTLHSSEDIKYKKSVKIPNLQNSHKVTRLQFAKSVMH